MILPTKAGVDAVCLAFALAPSPNSRRAGPLDCECGSRLFAGPFVTSSYRCSGQLRRQLLTQLALLDLILDVATPEIIPRLVAFQKTVEDGFVRSRISAVVMRPKIRQF